MLSQLDDHRPYGGVVPEIAARAHVEHLDRLILEAIAQAGIGFGDLDGVAATAGPGLIGGVMVGLTAGKAVALARKIPFSAVNHLEGHALSARLAVPLAFPYLLLLVSGGHCQLLSVNGVGAYTRYGTTLDDAAGEAFDKCAKLLGLGYPGGPAVAALASRGDGKRFKLPRPMLGRPDCHFSFSGLKTAVARLAFAHAPLSDTDRADIAAAFECAVADVIEDRTERAMAQFAGKHRNIPQPGFVVAGGVAANTALRTRLQVLAATHGFRPVIPPVDLCTDNAAMIAWAGIERLALGLSDSMNVKPRPRWPLDPHAPPATGAGVKA